MVCVPSFSYVGYRRLNEIVAIQLQQSYLLSYILHV